MIPKSPTRTRQRFSYNKLHLLYITAWDRYGGSSIQCLFLFAADRPELVPRAKPWFVKPTAQDFFGSRLSTSCQKGMISIAISGSRGD
jgi:hypothetical protein